MKTSTIEVHDMLSVFSVDEVEKRIGEVPGVQSVTVNFAAGSATVRFDETHQEHRRPGCTGADRRLHRLSRQPVADGHAEARAWGPGG